MRMLIFGGTGMLGRAVAREARSRRWPVLALSHLQADITSPRVARRWVADFRPGVVVNCAAFTRVDECEDRREHAFAVNGEAVGHLLAAAREGGAALVQLSTDYVFDGEASEPYREQAPTAPLSVYGRSKEEGERRALRGESSLVIRAGWLFGPGGTSFVGAILRRIEAGEPLRVVDDQVGRPTYTPFLARALCDLAVEGTRGTIHYGNREPVSWCGFARAIAHLWDRSAEVVPITTAELSRPAPRPAFSVLDVSRFETLTGRRVEAWEWGLAEYLSSVREERKEG